MFFSRKSILFLIFFGKSLEFPHFYHDFEIKRLSEDSSALASAFFLSFPT
jgi:hypothetical protein